MIQKKKGYLKFEVFLKFYLQNCFCRPNSWEKELVEPTSSRKTGHQVEGWGCHPTVKNSDPELFLSKRTAGTKMEKRLKERWFNVQPNLGSISWGVGRDRDQGLTLLLMLWCDYRQEPGVAVLRESLPAAD